MELSVRNLHRYTRVSGEGEGWEGSRASVISWPEHHCIPEVALSSGEDEERRSLGPDPSARQ